VSANLIALGYAWQRGLVPVGCEAILRAVELNGVAVEQNHLAFALGRLAAADAAGVGARAAAQVDEPLDALIERAVKHLTAYQDKAWARRFEARVRAVRSREANLPGADAKLPLTLSTARSLLKLMSYKDEYEVARLHSNGEFARQLAAQFEGKLKLEFHLAPPLLARMRHGQPVKVRFGGWMLPVMRWLARGKGLRGSVFDPFGYTQERRTERALIGQFEQLIDRLLRDLTPANQALAAEIAALPLSVRGFGHVKAANLALARVREAELLHRLSPQLYARPEGAPSARQFRGIAVVAR
jgi:indolepyruvate ferredoxin oxidoreductase